MIPNFANEYLGKVTKFQGYGLFRFGVLSNLLAWRWKTPPSPGMNRVKIVHQKYVAPFRSTQRAVLQNSCSTVGILMEN